MLHTHQPLPTPPNPPRSATLPIWVTDNRHLQTPFPLTPRLLTLSTRRCRSLLPQPSPISLNPLDETPTPPKRNSPNNDKLPKSTPPSNKTKRSRLQPPLHQLPFLPPPDILTLPDRYPLRPRPINPPTRARTWPDKGKNVVRKHPYPNNSKCYHCRVHGHFSQDCLQQECRWCNKTGHFPQNCLKHPRLLEEE